MASSFGLAGAATPLMDKSGRSVLVYPGSGGGMPGREYEKILEVAARPARVRHDRTGAGVRHPTGYHPEDGRSRHPGARELGRLPRAHLPVVTVRRVHGSLSLAGWCGGRHFARIGIGHPRALGREPFEGPCYGTKALQGETADVRIPAKWKVRFGPSGGVVSEQVEGSERSDAGVEVRQQPDRPRRPKPASSYAWTVLSG
jgi:hypothetical protein